MKKLKIKFVKFDKALVMQVLEQEGLPKHKDKGFVRIEAFPYLSRIFISLRGRMEDCNTSMDMLHLESNTERDKYLAKAINAITEELFRDESEPKIGDMCWCSNDGEQWELCKFAGKSSKVLGLDKRWLVFFASSDFLYRYRYVRKGSVDQPNVVEDGDYVIVNPPNIVEDGDNVIVEWCC